MSDEVHFVLRPVFLPLGNIAHANIQSIRHGGQGGTFYLWAGIAQRDKFTYESEFIPIELPTHEGINLHHIELEINMPPVEPVIGLGDAIIMLLREPHWDADRLLRSVWVRAFVIIPLEF